MSLINKMLQDLDKRHAADASGKTLTQQLRPVQTPRNWRRIVWEVGAGLLIGGGWAIWVYYQMEPRSLVTDLVLQMQAKRMPRPLGSQSPQASAQPAQAAPSAPMAAPAAPPQPTAAAPAAATATSPAAVPVAEGAKKPEFVPTDMLKLATEIATPIRERPLRQRTEPKPATATMTADKKVPAKREADGAKAGSVAETGAGPSIDKRAHQASPVERAENEFRRASSLLAEGRVAEAMDGYKLALRQDAGHAAARQALVGLLLDGRRVDEAQQFLQEGLKLNPDRSAYAMLLARIQVERGDLQGAHDLLRKHAGGGMDSAAYHAFDAAVLQRLGRHKEAITGYEAALKLSPQSGLWWMGLGISLQADRRNAEALDAFRRARSVGGLSPDLLAFVEQRVKQLQ